MICGHDMGGIWIEKPGPSRDFIKVRCNDLLHHDAPHNYIDYLSGMMVTQSIPPALIVDSRGCVQDA